MEKIIETKYKISSLYVHIPFCKSICAYCDFAKVFLHEKTAYNYTKTLIDELKSLKKRKYKTIYIGGGTPSSLPFCLLDNILNVLSSYLAKDYEFSIEANVEDINEQFLLLIKKHKINRLSIGVQTLNNDIVKIINRHHSKQMVIDNINLAKQYINNISVDLIYGLPNQTIIDIKYDLDEILKLNINHLSYYSLQVEPNTIFYQKHYQNLINEDELFKVYTFIYKYLSKSGFKRYEISNFAKKGYKSKHNLVYWHNKHYHAIGLNASGYIDNIRYTNTRNLTKYINKEGNKEIIQLKKEDIMFEQIMLNLRLDEGLNIKKFNKRFNCDFYKIYENQIKLLLNNKLIKLKNNKIKTTFKGSLLLNAVLEQFML